MDETDETDTKEAESDISPNSISLSNIAPRRPFPTPSRYLLNAWLCTCSGSRIVNTAQQPAPLYLCPSSSPLAAAHLLRCSLSYRAGGLLSMFLRLPYPGHVDQKAIHNTASISGFIYDRCCHLLEVK